VARPRVARFEDPAPMLSGPVAAYPRVVADVGGSTLRFGWVEAPDAAVAHVSSQPADACNGVEAAVARYLDTHGLSSPMAAAIGVAGPVIGDTVTMTNRNWTFSIDALRRRLGLERLVVLNDFAALAWGLPTLASGERRQVGEGRAESGAPVGLLGPGTGLGVSALLATGAGFVAVTGEGGHASLAAGSLLEEQIVASLRRRFGHASAEHVLSGPGIVHLYEALCELEGRAVEPLAPAEITRRARAGGDPCCRQALDLFFSFLGSMAGDLALTLGARGGIYIAGGIVARLGDEIDRSAFRERFVAKGRLRPYLSGIASSVITDASTLALRGANASLGS
jgi:glucokinase